MLLGLATIIGGTNPRAVGSILLFCFFAISHINHEIESGFIAKEQARLRSHIDIYENLINGTFLLSSPEHRVDGWVLKWRDIVLGPYTTGVAAVLCAAALVWTIFVARDWHHGSGGLLVVSFLTSVAIGMALELGQLLLNHVCCKCCPCHDDDAITDAPAGVVVAQPTA